MELTKSDSVYVRQLQLGPMKNFVYLIGERSGSEIAVIDPAWEAPAILEQARSDGKNITAVFLTHHHFDHINALPDLLKVLDVPIYVQDREADFATDALDEFRGSLRRVRPGESVAVGGQSITCIHTPGHTPGGQCLLCGGVLFSGDTLFVNACGRCDLPGGNSAALFDSLHRVLGTCSDDTVLYPGHDYGDVPISSLGRERSFNPYLRRQPSDEFIALRSKPRSSS
jgi:glyoxylase-like metal-dependent hydrolase (beta-lactamase superfamily II)